MRLVQLARKLGVTQNDIVSFLSANNIDIPPHGNSKLNEETITQILKHFPSPEENVEDPEDSAPPQEAGINIADQVKPETEEEKDTPEEQHSSRPPEPATAGAEDAESGPSADGPALPSEEQPQTEVEVIRAKKIKLEGIKVLGKIDLPEPVKKPAREADEDGEEKETSRKRPAGKSRKPQREQRNGGKRKKTETYEQKQRRKDREAEKKKRERERKLKEKKKKFYEQQVKEQKPAKAKKKPVRKKQHATVNTKKKVQRHSNPVIRFWEWLNGKYD